MKFCAVWRTGSRELFAWHRSDPMSRTAADGLVAALNATGDRLAHRERFDQSVSVGLPEGYDYATATTLAEKWPVD